MPTQKTIHNSRPTHKKRRSLFAHPTTQVALALLLFVLTVVASRGADMTGWEISLFKAVYTLPDALLPLFLIVTQLGSIYTLAVLTALYFVTQRYHIVIRVLMSGLLAYLLAGFAKDMWGRTRPHEFLLDVVSRDYIVRGPGFPSGHTALATALALTVGYYLPKKYRRLVPVFIVAVGLSRMYLGIHAPLDIVGGFAIGWFSYALFRHVRLQDVSFARKYRRRSVVR